MSKQPTHEDWQRARDKREQAAMQAVRSLLNGRTDEAMQQALKAGEQDDLMWSISKILDGPADA
jgi:hypothetical protein